MTIFEMGLYIYSIVSKPKKGEGWVQYISALECYKGIHIIEGVQYDNRHRTEYKNSRGILSLIDLRELIIYRK